MKKAMIAAAVLAASATLTGQMVPDTSKRLEKNDKFMRTQGGFVTKPDSKAGKVAIIDTQSRVDGAEFQKVAKDIEAITKMDFVYEKAEKDAPENLLAKSKAGFAVVIVDDAGSPAVLIALEDNWALLNVAKLDRNLTTDSAKEKFYVSRCRKELSRVIAILCGGSASQFPGNVMDVYKMEDLDLAVEGLPFDRIRAMTTYLEKNGFKAEQRTTYRKACIEGWAPAPTNDYQKAIWENVHAMPTEPIKIKPEEKKTEK